MSVRDWNYYLYKSYNLYGYSNKLVREGERQLVITVACKYQLRKHQGSDWTRDVTSTPVHYKSKRRVQKDPFPCSYIHKTAEKLL